ncbi:alpha/beta hydrolase [Myxococcota bacterium]|nr:alpha/beta hydrolase [Myxococcota bacterium]
MGLADRNFEIIETNGIRLRCVVEGDGPLVILLHGFPQCWYLWRNQIDPLIDAGFRVAVPDQRGYGGSDRPPEIADYGILDLTADVDGIATALGHEDYALVIHDWGCIVGYHTALLYPDRVRAVAALSVPYVRSPLWKPMCTQEFHGENFFYWAHFQEPGVVERELEADIRGTLLSMYYGASGDAPEPDPNAPPKKAGSKFLEGIQLPETLPSWLTVQDLDYYVSLFEQSGFRGPVNWYRNLPRLLELTPQLEGVQIQPPVYFMMGTRDGVRHFIPPEGMEERYRDLRAKVFVEGKGHWLPIEASQEVNDQVIPFLSELR